MDPTCQRFARRVLLIHALLLAVVIGVVFAASHEIYKTARQQVIDQAKQQQVLLAGQTAGGIESFFDSIHSDLDLLRRTDNEEDPVSWYPSTGPGSTQPAPVPMPPPVPLLPKGLARQNPAIDATTNLLKGRFSELVGGIMWRQLHGRAAMLLVVDREKLAKGESGTLDRTAVHVVGPIEQFSPTLRAPSAATWQDALRIVDKGHLWLRSVEKPSVSPFEDVGDNTDLPGGVVLVCIPMQENRARRLLVAVVPAREIEARFLVKLNADSAAARAMISGGPAARPPATAPTGEPALGRSGNTSLLDETMATMASSDPSLIGASGMEVDDPPVRELVQQFLRSGSPGTTVLETPYTVRGIARQPRIVSVEPVRVIGKQWALLISSPLADAEAVVHRLFSQVLWWAIFVVVSVTGILVSTSLQVIRARTRLERVQHEVLQKEISQARQIQLAWLPNAKDRFPAVDIAAANTPASHISGDFYNWFALADGRVVVTIGDVTGHGMAAAFLMATTQLLVRTTMMRVSDPGRCLEEVNRQLCTQIFNGQFVTMLIVVLDLRTGEVEAATAGHYPPLISDGESFQPLAMEYQLVLGVEKNVTYPTERFELPPRASLLLYTDGVLDVRNARGDRFESGGLQRSLYGPIATAQSMIDSVRGAIDRFRGARELPDDLTLVGIQVAISRDGRASSPETPGKDALPGPSQLSPVR